MPALGSAPETALRPRLRPSDLRARRVPETNAIVTAAQLGGSVSFAVADLSDGEKLERLNGDVGTPPASVTKAVTALYALEALGPGHRFATRLVSTAPVENGVVTGDLVLKGGGDPVLDTEGLAELAAALKARGIREVKGRFLVDDTFLPRTDRIDPAQPDHVGYNPAIAGVALNFNRVHFEWKRASNGYAVTMDARTARYRPDVEIATMRVVRRNLPIYTYQAGARRDEWTVAQHALGNGGARWLPVRLPGLYAGDVFRTLARSHGIVLTAPQLARQPVGGTVLAMHESPPVQTLVRQMLRYSNNMMAEMLGMAATRAREGRALGLKASATRMSLWAGTRLGMRETRLVDHSGLGDASRMSADEMCTALVGVSEAGFRGLLKKVEMGQSRAAIKVNAKTGTLHFVSALAGYMTAPDGREFAFAIFAADTAARARLTRATRERPQGSRSWSRRARTMQKNLIARWAELYAG